MFNEPFYTAEEKLRYGNHTAEGILFEYVWGLGNGRIYFSTEREFTLSKFATAVACVTAHLTMHNLPRMNGFSGWDCVRFEQIRPFGVVCVENRGDGELEYITYFDTKEKAQEYMDHMDERQQKYWGEMFIREETEYGYTRLTSRMEAQRKLRKSQQQY